MRVGKVIVESLGIGLRRAVRITNSEGKYLSLEFSPYVYPIFPSNSPYLVRGSGSGSFTTNSKLIEIPYALRVLQDYPITIDSGVKVLEVSDGKESRTLYNRPLIPDFTTPYVVFGLSGGVMVLIFSVFTKVLLDLI